jgi:hypothetical protein
MMETKGSLLQVRLGLPYLTLLVAGLTVSLVGRRPGPPARVVGLI